MKLGNRKLKKILLCIFKPEHYVAFLNMFLIYKNPIDSIGRYLFATGEYPKKIEIKFNKKTLSPKIFSSYDMLTVNEIFCRKDYGKNKDAEVVVDIGSNIGISALYFLNLNKNSKCYLFEPVPLNIKKLEENLKDYKERYILSKNAISNKSGKLKFGTEEYGRCGGLNRSSDKSIFVDCIHINTALSNILNENKKIDILKIDTEGNELEIVKAIKPEYLKKIKTIYFEIDFSVDNKIQILFPDLFHQKQYANVISLISKK